MPTNSSNMLNASSSATDTVQRYDGWDHHTAAFCCVIGQDYGQFAAQLYPTLISSKHSRWGMVGVKSDLPVLTSQAWPYHVWMEHRAF